MIQGSYRGKQVCLDKQGEPSLVYTLRYALVCIYYLYHCHEKNCRKKEPLFFVEVMNPEGSQCIQRNNTLEVKTPGLIVVIVILLTYVSKVFYITSKCCS
jgi:hypothetical protein